MSASSNASRKRYPDRGRARNKVARAVASGRLVRPDRCEQCGAACRPEAAHTDYSKPLEIEWLCRPCHEEKDRPTHCIHGHEFTPDNTYTDPVGKRQCRTCKRRRKAEYRAKKKAAHA